MAIFGKNHNGVNGAGPHTSTGINTNKSVPVWTLPVRIVQFLFALLVLALCGHAKNYFGDYT